MVKVVSLFPLPDTLLKAEISSVYSGEIEVVVITEYDEDRILKEFQDADIIIGNYRIPINRKMFETMKKVRLFQQPSTGYNNIDIEAAKELGIRVANVGGVNAGSVAEHTIMCAIALLRKLMHAHARVMEGVWTQREMYDLGIYDLEGKTWGILGMGN